MNIRHPYSPRLRVAIDFTGETSLTKPEFKGDCDINNIIAQYRETGVIQHLNKNQGIYADLSDSVDYQTAQNIVLAADAAFGSLSAKVRARFDNNPAAFLAFCEDPANAQEMIDLGFRTPEVIPEPHKPLKPKRVPREPVAEGEGDPGENSEPPAPK
ncbi:internal scaffolding protein [Microviridae sp.]|nr:internal scaffolding protein [Microviridae sp.]